MQKSYDPNQFEEKLYEKWLDYDCFSAKEKSSLPAFSMAMPPPNVTGVLHNGHALFVTIEDALTRWKRMKGFNALWLPGVDHAGIATQMVVERELSKQGLKRREMGRSAFLEKVWEWKEKHGEIINGQMKKLGASADWSRSRFTMDPALSKTVREVFVSLYKEQAIFKGTRLINWCTRCQTALSDLEVVAKEKKGSFWHLKYVVEKAIAGAPKELIIATTRPETLLGDTAVAVHPQDERYAKLKGLSVTLPLLHKSIPIIMDEYVDKEFGSGGLKVTPGHDFNDYNLGKKHALPIISVFDKQGIVNENGGPYQGLSIADARKKIIEDLTATGFLVKEEPHTHSAGVCQRCETVVEPMISEQWFMDVKPMALQAVHAVRRGEKLTLKEVDAREDSIKIVPETWLSTFYHWMENIQEWCISRQLWWGHQIPAWYCRDCKHITVAKEDPTQCEKCASKKITQDEDVLDTWFSSGLWPFSTLGWPEKTEAYKTFYPTTIMETGSDILFFWVARMIMMGMHFNQGRVPFKRVYLHAMVRDEKGQKMSKTKGNVIDPLDIIKDYGADAFRFTLSSMAGQGRDVKLSLDRVEGYKGFCNKLWNASRFTLMKLGVVQFEGMAPQPRFDFEQVIGKEGSLEKYLIHHFSKLHPINKWILSRLNESVSRIDQGFEEFKLNESAGEVYSFMWNEYCDWYIELSKELLEKAETREQTAVCLLYVLSQALKLAHPLIPFVTEEIFQNLPAKHFMTKTHHDKRPESILALEAYPVRVEEFNDTTSMELIGFWKNTVEKMRTFRGENNISPKVRVSYTYEVKDEREKQMLEHGIDLLKNLVGAEKIQPDHGMLKGKSTVSQILCSSTIFYVDLSGLVDVEAEVKRVEKEIKATKTDIDFVANKLGKETFIAKAPKELVAAEKAKLAQFQAKIVELEEALARLQKLG